MYQLIDYSTGQPINDKLYKTKKVAITARWQYLKEMRASGEIHNNLILVLKANQTNEN